MSQSTSISNGNILWSDFLRKNVSQKRRWVIGASPIFIIWFFHASNREFYTLTILLFFGCFNWKWWEWGRCMLEGNLSKVKIIVQQVNLNTYLSNSTELNIFYNRRIEQNNMKHFISHLWETCKIKRNT